jgi:NAD(P)-dependent dehydrogenase (short-subunit alcohol dehydrogenase family)
MKIVVSLGGRNALVAGSGPLAAEIAQALRDSGADIATATLTGAEPELDRSTAAHGRLDVLVTVSGEGTDDAPVPLMERLCRRSAAAMADGGGRIVNVAPALGLLPVRDASAASAEAAAIFSLTRVLAMELGGRGVRVNAIAFGALETGGPLGERMLSHVPLARKGRTDEVAAAVLFLVDPDNTYMTGHVLTVDGGWSAGYARDF